MTRLLVRLLAAVGWMLLLVVSACGGNAPIQRRPRDAYDTYRSSASPPGSTMLPDSLGGVRWPREMVLNPTNGHVYICGTIGDAGVAVLDAATGKHIGLIPARDADALLCNPRTNLLYVGTGFGSRRELLVVDCVCDSIVTKDTQHLWPLAVNQTDNKLYAAVVEGRDTKVAILDGKTLRMLGKVRVGPIAHSDLHDILWNPTSNTLFCNDASSGAIVVIDGRSNRAVARIRTKDRLYPVCVNTKNNKLYAKSPDAEDSSVAVIDCRANRVITWLPLDRGIDTMAYSPSVNKVYCADRSGYGGSGSPSVVVIDGTSDRVLTRIALPGDPGSLCCDSIGNRIYCFGDCDSWVATIDCRTDSVTTIFHAGDGSFPAVFYQPANRLYCLDWQHGDVCVVDCHPPIVVDTVTLGYTVESILYSRKQDKLYCANKMGHSLAVLDGESGRVLGTIKVGRNPTALTSSRDGSRLYCANQDDGTVSAIDCGDDRVVATVSVGRVPSALCFSPAANRLFCANSGTSESAFDSTVSVIDCRTNAVVTALRVALHPEYLAYDSIHDRVFSASSTKGSPQGGPETQIDGFDAASLASVLRVRFQGFPRDMCYDPIHDRLYVLHEEPDKVTVVDCKTAVVKVQFWAGGSPERACYAQLLHKLYCASPDLASGGGTEGNDDKVLPGRSEDVSCGRTLAIVNTDVDSSIAKLEVPNGPSALRYVPEVDRVYCACSSSDTVVVIDCDSDRIVERVAVGSNPRALDYSPKHGLVFIASGDGSVSRIMVVDWPIPGR
jgi:YVTN family beta-propeller protein